jgi:hypothetical protein
MPAPIALTDAQLDAVFRAAAPLAVHERDAFLQDVAAILRGVVAPGDGDIYRAIREAQRRHWDPPLSMEHEPRHRAVAR